MNEFFRHVAHGASVAVGTPWAFLLALTAVIVWFLAGPGYGYSDSWQMLINTGTTIITFLMVFVIQNTQNRDVRVTQLKLDELLRSVKAARTGLVALEEMSDEELARLEKEFKGLHARVNKLRSERTAPSSPEHDE